MGDAKGIMLRPVSSSTAREVIRRLHYSKSVVNNSQFHIGVWWRGKMEGAMQFGPPMDKGHVIGLVSGTPWNGVVELNRMAFSAALPRNSESRALSIAMRLLRKYAPHVQWVLTFADGTQCGDGTIYRAAGFLLTGIGVNDQVWQNPLHDTNITRFTVSKSPGMMTTGITSMRHFRDAGWRPKAGHQLRYIYPLVPGVRGRLTVPVLPHSEIARLGAGMYLGKFRAAGVGSDTAGVQPAEGGAIPTAALEADADGPSEPEAAPPPAGAGGKRER